MMESQKRQDIIDEGYNAAQVDIVVGYNPYHPNNPQHWYWIKGWLKYRMEKIRNDKEKKR